MSRILTKIAVVAAAVGLGSAGVAAASASTSAAPSATFTMVRSQGATAANCIPNASATVNVVNHGITETMDVDVTGLPANTDFDLFVIQVPDAPFGVSWYQGDLETGANGTGHGEYVGRFSVETFAVAPNTAPAPNVRPGLVATSNPPFLPIHMFHVGLWFNSPTDAAHAGCPNTVTPFNGEHNAGVQALSTRNFDIKHGPLRQITS